MSNLDLARFLATVAWHLSCMVTWQIRGNLAMAARCEEDFRKAMKKLDEIEEPEVVRHDA